MNRSITLLVVACLASGIAPVHAAQPKYFKMIATRDAAHMRRGQILRPRFAQKLLDENHPVYFGNTTSYNGGATERLFAETLAELKRSGKVDQDLPGRTDGVFVTTDLDRFPQFRDDPMRTKVQLAPLSDKQVGTYDRRHLLNAVRALDRADRAKGAEKARHLAHAKREAEKYYLEAPNLENPRTQPETLLGGGGKVVKVSVRKD